MYSEDTIKYEKKRIKGYENDLKNLNKLFESAKKAYEGLKLTSSTASSSSSSSSSGTASSTSSGTASSSSSSTAASSSGSTKISKKNATKYIAKNTGTNPKANSSKLDSSFKKSGMSALMKSFPKLDQLKTEVVSQYMNLMNPYYNYKDSLKNAPANFLNVINKQITMTKSFLDEYEKLAKILSNSVSQMDQALKTKSTTPFASMAFAVEV